MHTTATTTSSRIYVSLFNLSVRESSFENLKENIGRSHTNRKHSTTERTGTNIGPATHTDRKVSGVVHTKYDKDAE